MGLLLFVFDEMAGRLRGEATIVPGWIMRRWKGVEDRLKRRQRQSQRLEVHPHAALVGAHFVRTTLLSRSEAMYI